MQELDLSHNKLVGQFPLCLTHLSGLRVLDLSSNQLTGKLPPSLGSLKSLEYLSLFDNDFEGFFSLGSLTNISNLSVLKLCSKSNSLQVVSDSSWKPKFQFDVIALQSCNLEKVPQFLLHQKELRHVDLSDNNISGNFPSWLLENNRKLKVLLLQNNSFTSFHLPEYAHRLLFLDVSVNKLNHLLPENIGWILPHLRYMNISKNGFQGTLPSSLGNMKNIEYMDLSRNSFHGELPRSFLNGCDSMAILKLSHNKLSGEIFHEPPIFTNILGLFMENNLFTGKIGQGLQSLRNLSLLDISNNNLTGVVPSWIGELPSLTALLIANNLLDGSIPTSLFNNSNLQLLDLSTNNLSGGIPPHHNSRNGVVSLFGAAFFLHDNNLSGAIPDTLLGNVTILDLRNNWLSGNIPDFINTQEITILLLRGNNLTGPIPRQLCDLRNIHLLDLANNKLNGSIPACLSNTSFGLGSEEDAFSSFDFSFGVSSSAGRYFSSFLVLDPFNAGFLARSTRTKIEFEIKHRYDSYIGENLQLLFGMDLSKNELSGEIPVELGALMELQALNLSHNKLSGVIPESFQGLKNVESLDLSSNWLQGRIPPQLAELSSLAVFNVSFNNLSGVIPQGRQFNTFDSQSFLGNPFLCGQQTNTSCGGNSIHSPDNVVKDEEGTIDMESFYWSFAAAYVTILVGNLDKFPHFLRQQKGLREVDLSNNKISGNFPTWLMENNKELQVLRLENNYLANFQLPKSTHGLGFLDVSVNKFNHLFPENIGWILPQLSIMNISGNGFQGNLPFSLSNMTEILYLDISHNNFQGKIPRGFLKECYFIGSLKLSHNRFSGEVFPEEVPAFSGISELFMDNNQFTGNIGKGLGNLQYLLVLDISNSSLLGVIPNCIGQLPQLTALLLSNNSLEGNIPTSLFNMSNLYLLDLSANRLSGDIPPHIISAMPSIVFLQDNNLSGIIPDTLLMNVTVLDLRNNRLSGSIPEFTNIQSIGILLLRGNDLTGRIPRHLCGLRTIHLLDLANNRLNGPTPSCLGNASFGLGKEDSLYLFELRSGEMSTSFELGYALEQDSTPKKGVGGFFNSLLVLDPFIGGIMEKSTRTKIEFATKHRYDSYMGGNLELLIGMDLSENELSGEIPFGLGDLHKLHALNLSHNKLSGVVPKSFSGLKNMESLDLSFNRLQGRIPSQLAELSSLAVFNVSFNNLSGVIPQGKQFNTFDSQSFLGNPFLCGLPTSTSCYNSGNFFQEPDNEVEEDEGHINMISFYWSFAGAYVTILLEIISSLTFDSPWSRFWFYKVDVFIHKVRKLLFCN
uniref:Uncharacterized protein n=1 Tax=Brassica oleracea TaxID=3712 RepID=A0A3P6DR28_BRAOL|nr:unnamed protein product [Brassica oleracea]